MPEAKQPFITIGVTTYNRREMLKECLDSISAQTFIDFEVIVGNDYTSDKLSLDEFNLDGQRFKIVNHEKNLGERNNMNWLLHAAKGKYFTWLADDDAYYPNFLESIHRTLITNEKLDCVFSSYNFEECFNTNDVSQSYNVSLMTGSELLLKYYKNEILLHGCYGVFEIEYLREIGGMQQTGSGASPYSSDIIMLHTALKEQIGYLHNPPIFYRLHENAWSLATTDIISYVTSQIDILDFLKEVFSDKNFLNKKKLLTFLLTKRFIDHFFGIKCRIKKKGIHQGENGCSWTDYFLIINKNIRNIDSSQLFKVNLHLLKRYMMYILYSVKPLYKLLGCIKNKVSH
jgi:glycosyltransferase involved in cell wall biosynthesis